MNYSLFDDECTSRPTQIGLRTDNFSYYLNSLRFEHPAPAIELFHGDALDVLASLPRHSIDCVVTSPPYWNQREYGTGTLGLEPDPVTYVKNLCNIFDELYRTLKPTGSLWLNLGDSYRNKSLVGIPWRVALEMTDNRNWILRNSVIWHKLKGGMDNSKDKLGNVHENIFHFVKHSRGYYYDADAIRARPVQSKVFKGQVVSATGVSGVRYRKQIENSPVLSQTEKEEALQALNEIVADVRNGHLHDFRMIIRGQQRTTHSDSLRLSGRAKELAERGFYFLKYNPKGSKPADVWEILPEDTQMRTVHFAPFPTDLCQIPILATCPKDGLVLDPFCGTGSTLHAAKLLERSSIGIDTCMEYLTYARERLAHE